MKKKKKAEPGDKASDLPERLERFLASPLAALAGKGLSDLVCVALHVDGEEFFFRRREGEFILSRVAEPKADVHFWIHLSTLRQLLDLAEQPRIGVASLGVAIFEHIFAQDEENKIRFRVDGGFLSLWGKGYFSVLKAGGPEVASYLARFGYSGIAAVKAALKNIRKG